MQKKKGISLIVLVITIIVMIVLAGAIILSLNNAGIIGKANKAVKDADKATIKQLAQMAWAEAYASGAREVEGESGLRAKIEETLKKNGINPEEYLLNVTTSGVTAKLKKDAWIKQGFTVVKGEQILEIGDVVNYDETRGGTIILENDVSWRVLGADADGNLLLLSATAVKQSHKLGNTTSVKEKAIEQCQSDWLNAVSELNEICKSYGKGEGALAIRSITLEDVNTVAGYKPENSTVGKGKVYEYGNEVTYYYNSSLYPSYTSKVTGQDAKFDLTDEHSYAFIIYDGSKFVSISPEELTSDKNNGKVLGVLKNTSCYYDANFLLTKNPKAHEMIFGEYNEETGKYSSYYWLATPLIRTLESRVSYAIHRVYSGDVNFMELLYSKGSTYNQKYDVRAVVTISSDIEITGSSEAGWSY